MTIHYYLTGSTPPIVTRMLAVVRRGSVSWAWRKRSRYRERKVIPGID